MFEIYPNPLSVLSSLKNGSNLFRNFKFVFDSVDAFSEASFVAALSSAVLAILVKAPLLIKVL